MVDSGDSLGVEGTPSEERVCWSPRFVLVSPQRLSSCPWLATHKYHTPTPSSPLTLMPGHSKQKPSYPFANQGTGNVSSSGSPSSSDPLYPPPSSSSSSHTSPYRQSNHSPYSDSPSRDLYFPNSPASSSVHMDRAEGAGQVYGTASSRGGTNSMMSSSSSFVAPLLPSEDRHGSISGSSTRSYQVSSCTPSRARQAFISSFPWKGLELGTIERPELTPLFPPVSSPPLSFSHARSCLALCWTVGLKGVDGW